MEIRNILHTVSSFMKHKLMSLYNLYKYRLCLLYNDLFLSLTNIFAWKQQIIIPELLHFPHFPTCRTNYCFETHKHILNSIWYNFIPFHFPLEQYGISFLRIQYIFKKVCSSIYYFTILCISYLFENFCYGWFKWFCVFLLPQLVSGPALGCKSLSSCSSSFFSIAPIPVYWM